MPGGTAVSRVSVKTKTPLSPPDNSRQIQRVMRFELTTFTLAT